MTSNAPRWNPEIRPFEGPKYLSLANTIGAAIKSGELKPGDRLPSHRELGDVFGVTIATITKGISEAARQGYVVARKGSGTFVRELVDVQTADLSIDLGLNTLPAEFVRDLLVGGWQRLTSQSRAGQLFSYSSYHVGGSEVATAKEWLKSNGVGFPSAHAVFPTVGVQQGLIAAIATLVEPGKPILCEAWTYTGILRACGLRGAIVHGVAFDSEGALPAALDRALAETGAHVFVCTPSVHNPTGRTMSEARRLEIADILRRRGAYLIEDAVNMPLSGGEQTSIASHAPQCTILLSGFSKCTAPGLRFAVASC